MVWCCNHVIIVIVLLTCSILIHTFDIWPYILLQTVYIYNCKGATIQVLGKVNMITVDKCVKTNVVFNDTMGGCELVNCKGTKVQANGQCPTVAIDKTDGCVVYAGKVCWENLTVGKFSALL